MFRKKDTQKVTLVNCITDIINTVNVSKKPKNNDRSSNIRDESVDTSEEENSNSSFYFNSSSGNSFSNP
jgi:hypothetical protein